MCLFYGSCGYGGWIDIRDFARYIKEKNKEMKVALFSGNEKLPLNDLVDFDYVKTGSYIAELGPLNSPTTNQRMYKNIGNGKWEDITKNYQIKK